MCWRRISSLVSQKGFGDRRFRSAMFDASSSSQVPGEKIAERMTNQFAERLYFFSFFREEVSWVMLQCL